MNPSFIKIEYFVKKSPRIMILQEGSRELLTDAALHSNAAIDKAVNRSLRVYEKDKFQNFEGIVQFREEKEKALEDFLKSKPSILDLIKFANELQVDAAEFTLERTSTHRRPANKKSKVNTVNRISVAGDTIQENIPLRKDGYLAYCEQVAVIDEDDMWWFLSEDIEKIRKEFSLTSAEKLEKIPDVKALLQKYRNAIFHGTPCQSDWEGCSELRWAYKKELDALEDNCTLCEKNAIEAKYNSVVENKVKELIKDKHGDITL